MNNLDLLMKQLEAKKENEDYKNNEWKVYLQKDNNGKYINCIDNYISYFVNSSKYCGKIKYNEFLQQKEIDGREFNDFDEACSCNDIEHELGLSNTTKTHNALMQVFNINRYNPVKEYLERLSWDGIKRIEEIFIKCFDIDDTELVRRLSKKWFIAAVKRVMEPGCQFDNMIVLQGPSGIGKTTFCRLLSNDFYSEIKFDEITNKDIVDKLNKSWFCIIDEMGDFNRKEMGIIKSFLSTRKELVRLAYGRNTNTYYRHCIFIGSLNDETFLRDTSSDGAERRFWVFKCNKTTKDDAITRILTKETVDQIWAETMHYYKEDPNQYLDLEFDLMDSFENEQKQFKTLNDDQVKDYVNNILNKKYVLNDKGEFNSDSDFLRQFTEENMYDDMIKSELTKIPISSLKYVLKKVYNEDRSGRYIGKLVEGEWKYSSVKYYGSKDVKAGLIRK